MTKQKMKKNYIYILMVTVYAAIVIAAIVMINNVPRDYLKMQSSSYLDAQEKINSLLDKGTLTDESLQAIAEAYPIEFIIYNETESAIVFQTISVEKPGELQGLLNKKAISKEAVYKHTVGGTIYSIWIAQYNISPQSLIDRWLFLIIILVVILFIIISAVILGILYRLIIPLRKLRENIYKITSYQLDKVSEDKLTPSLNKDDNVLSYELANFAKDLGSKIERAEVVYTSLEKELQMQNENSEYRFRMLATQSHDLKTSLHTAQLQIEKINAEKAIADPKMQFFLDITYEKVVNVLTDIDGIIKTAFQDNVEQLKQVETFDLVDMLYTVHDLFIEEISTRHLQVTIDTDETVLFTGNKIQMKQLIHNAISNICRYALQGANVDIVCFQEDNKIILKFYNDAKQLPTEALPNIFKLFYRIDENNKGTGVGLFAVKQIVEDNNGQVAFHNVRDGIELSCVFTIE